MNGFVTIAKGDPWLQRAAMLAVSARRFGYPTILMTVETDASRYADLFHRVVDIGQAAPPLVNPPGACAHWELKKYAGAVTWDDFETCAYVDADSTVIKDPAPIFRIEAPVHTPGTERRVASGQRWAIPHPISSTGWVTERLGIDQPLQMLNGGFFVYRKSPEAEQWFEEFQRNFERLQQLYAPQGVTGGVRDELCMSLAYARLGIKLETSDTSIGLWDAENLTLDIANQVFECKKGYHWGGHHFSPIIAHWGHRGHPRYQDCVYWLCRDADLPVPKLFRTNPDLIKNGFAITGDCAAFLREYIEQHRFKRVLEFGPGASTQVFAAAGCDVVTCEYDGKWLAHYRQKFAGLPNVELRQFENTQPIKLAGQELGRFDLAFVDSPIGTKTRSRLNTSEAADRHSDRWILHDATRRGERETLNYFAAQGRQVQLRGKMGVVTRA